MRDHGGRCPGSVTRGCGRRGTPRARSPGVPVGAWRRRLSKPVPGSAKGTICTACPVSPDESPLNTGRCLPQMHLRDARIEDTLVILRLLPGWSRSLPRLPPAGERGSPRRAPPRPQPWAPHCCVQPRLQATVPQGPGRPMTTKHRGATLRRENAAKYPRRPARVLTGRCGEPGAPGPPSAAARRSPAAACRALLRRDAACAPLPESPRGPRARPGPRRAVFGRAVSPPTLTTGVSARAGTVFRVRGDRHLLTRKGLRSGGGRRGPRRPPGDAVGAPAFLSFSTRKRHRFRH